MKTPRKLTKKEQSAITKIQKAFTGFPNTLQVFAYSGTMMITDKSSGQVFLTILGAYADGGDPGTIHIDGAEFLDLK